MCLTKNPAYDNLDKDDVEFLSHHLSQSSSKNYSCMWKKFSSYCQDLNLDPYNCSPSSIVKYLRKLYNEGAQFRTINLVRSSISKLYLGFNGVPAGQHLIVKQALKAIFRLCPPLPRYTETYDANKVLIYIKQILGKNELLTLRLLSFKCLFLLSITSISRVSTMSSLGASVKFGQGGTAVIPIIRLEKQSRGEETILNIKAVLILSNFYFSYQPFCLTWVPHHC